MPGARTRSSATSESAVSGMSDRHRRYLAALGIPLWLSRRVLPGAAQPVPADAQALSGPPFEPDPATAQQAPEGPPALPAGVETRRAAPAGDETQRLQLPDADAVEPLPMPLPAPPLARPASPARPALAAEAIEPPPAPAVAEPAPALRPVRPPPATPVPADIDDWLPPETDPPPSAPPRPRAQAAAAAPVPPPAAADEAIDAGGGGDDWTDYAQWAAMSADVHDDDAPADAPPPADDRRARILGMDWDELASTVAGCSACPLCRTRTRTVFGTGDRRARLMLVGEAPGRDEDLQGEPFVGEAGKLLNEMLRAIGLSRAEVYIANVLKCRPPQNRDPLPAEALACRAHLDRQIALVGPELIVALGRIPAHELLATQTQVGRLRGRWHRYGPAAIPLLVTYHPAYLLRSPAEKGKSLDDLERVLDVLEGRTAPDCGPDAS